MFFCFCNFFSHIFEEDHVGAFLDIELADEFAAGEDYFDTGAVDNFAESFFAAAVIENGRSFVCVEDTEKDGDQIGAVGEQHADEIRFCVFFKLANFARNDQGFDQHGDIFDGSGTGIFV